MSTSESPTITLMTTDAEQTLALGTTLGSRLFPGGVVALVGELGAGKTVLAKGIARGLGVVDDRAVVSPTFVFMTLHQGRVPLYHFDAYRLPDARSFIDLGVDEYLTGSGVCVIEWADIVTDALPQERLEIHLHHRPDSARQIDFYDIAGRYGNVLESLTTP